MSIMPLNKINWSTKLYNRESVQPFRQFKNLCIIKELWEQKKNGMIIVLKVCKFYYIYKHLEFFNTN